MSGGAASSGSAASSAQQARCCGRPPPRRRAADAQGLGEPPDHGVPRGELAGDGCFVWGAAPRLGRRAVQATLRVHCMPPPAPALRSSRTSRPPCHPSLAARPPPPPPAGPPQALPGDARRGRRALAPHLRPARALGGAAVRPAGAGAPARGAGLTRKARCWQDGTRPARQAAVALPGIRAQQARACAPPTRPAPLPGRGAGADQRHEAQPKGIEHSSNHDRPPLPSCLVSFLAGRGAGADQ